MCLHNYICMFVYLWISPSETILTHHCNILHKGFVHFSKVTLIFIYVYLNMLIIRYSPIIIFTNVVMVLMEYTKARMLWSKLYDVNTQKSDLSVFRISLLSEDLENQIVH